MGQKRTQTIINGRKNVVSYMLPRKIIFYIIYLKKRELSLHIDHIIFKQAWA